MPGKSTALRKGTIGSAPSGSTGTSGGSAGFVSICELSFMGQLETGYTTSKLIELGESEHEAAIEQLAGGKLQPIGPKRDAPLEMAVRDLQPDDVGMAILRGQGPVTDDHQHLALHVDANRLGRNAGQCGDDEELARRLKHIDGWLPSRGARARRGGLEELALQALSLVEQGTGLRPHQIFGVTHGYRLSWSILTPE